MNIKVSEMPKIEKKKKSIYTKVYSKVSYILSVMFLLRPD